MTKKTTSLNPGLGQESPEGVLRNKTPSRAYELAKKYFFKSLSTIDIGSGAGTNTAWLNENGYESVGIESDNELRLKAQEQYPNLKFILDGLPHLKSVVNTKYTNVFACDSLISLPQDQLLTGIINITRITLMGGKIICCFRHTSAGQERRRIYTHHPDQIALLFERQGGKVHLLERDSAWYYLVIEKVI